MKKIANSQSMVIDGIDLKEAGVIKRGTFNSKGFPTGWHIDASNRSPTIDPSEAVLRINNRGKKPTVHLLGKYSPTLTAELKKAVGF